MSQVRVLSPLTSQFSSRKQGDPEPVRPLRRSISREPIVQTRSGKEIMNRYNYPDETKNNAVTYQLAPTRADDVVPRLPHCLRRYAWTQQKKQQSTQKPVFFNKTLLWTTCKRKHKDSALKTRGLPYKYVFKCSSFKNKMFLKPSDFKCSFVL